jgi:hypothetical protein
VRAWGGGPPGRLRLLPCTSLSLTLAVTLRQVLADSRLSTGQLLS